MTDRLKQARALLHPGGIEVAEYNARMGGYLDAAITLISIASADAVENLERNPGDRATQEAIALMAQAQERLERLVAHLCPLTATPLNAMEAAGHG